MRHFVITCLLVLLAAPAYAQLGSVTYTFSAGTTARASEVNANFSAIHTNALKRNGSGSITGATTVDGSGTLTFNTGTELIFATGSALQLAADALQIADSNASHYLIVTPGSDLSANRVLTLTTGDAARTITLSGNPTLSDWFDQSVKTTATPTFGNTTLTGTLSVAGTLTASGGGVLTDPELTNYRETKATAAISAGDLTLDLDDGNHFAVALNADIDGTFAISNVPATGKAAAVTITFTADGTIRDITWPTGTVWPGGSPPVMTGTNNKRDIITLYTWDGGTVWFGFINGQDF